MGDSTPIRYLIKQEMFNKEPNKLIAIRKTKQEAINLVKYLQEVDPKNTYYHHSDTIPPSDNR